ncbi:MAG TPA: hypothetical protein VL490_05350 [Mucilaginibacter sp.]|jgi:hypothetical protein|nr:hypothetical protein [Mucilaginibacter sp.]
MKNSIKFAAIALVMASFVACKGSSSATTDTVKTDTTVQTDTAAADTAAADTAKVDTSKKM